MLHGKAVIELHNTRTHQSKRIVHHNMLTNWVRDYLKPASFLQTMIGDPAAIHARSWGGVSPSIMLGGLLMFGSTLNLLSLLGLISLAGVVVNNGIILVDYINQLRAQRRHVLARTKGTQNKDGEWEIKLNPEEEDNLLRTSVLDGAASRIKPIFITTLTTLLGDIPMALAKGEGSELYASMGQAIAGGLLTSTLITLILIPVIYYISEKRGKHE